MARNSFYEVTFTNGETETIVSELMRINGKFLVFYNQASERKDLVVLYAANEVKKVKKLHTSKGDSSESTKQDN